jgi:hypothetical protein
MSRQTAKVEPTKEEVDAAIRAEEAKKVDILPHQEEKEVAEAEKASTTE